MCSDIWTAQKWKAIRNPDFIHYMKTGEKTSKRTWNIIVHRYVYSSLYCPFLLLIFEYNNLTSYEDVYVFILKISPGIFFTDGHLWHEQRRFVLRYLRDYGFGRRYQLLEIEIHDEFKIFIDMVKYGPKYSHEKVNNIKI